MVPKPWAWLGLSLAGSDLCQAKEAIPAAPQWKFRQEVPCLHLPHPLQPQKLLHKLLGFANTLSSVLHLPTHRRLLAEL